LLSPNQALQNILIKSEQRLLLLFVSLFLTGLLLSHYQLVYASNAVSGQVENLKKEIETDYIQTFDLNTATYNELLTVKGIGPKKATDIIEYRKGKSFTSVEQLTEIKGIGKKTLEKLSPFFYVIKNDKPTFFIVSADSQPSKQKDVSMNQKIDILTASHSELIKLNGIGEVKAKAIIEYRETHVISTFEDLLNIKGIGPKILEKIKQQTVIGKTSKQNTDTSIVESGI